MDADVDQTVGVDSSGAGELSEKVLCFCEWKPVCANTFRALLALVQLIGKHQRPQVVDFSKASDSFQK